MADWSRLYEHRKSVAARYPAGIWSVPVAKRYHTVLEPIGTRGTRVLEVGAGARGLRKRLSGAWGDVSYVSCDIDRSTPHDFHDIEDVTGVFDLVVGLEVIEHLSLESAMRLVERAHALLVDGGVIALTTPNTFYPPAYLRDATHVTPFCFDELGGVLLAGGFEVSAVYRLHHDALLKKALKRTLLYPLYRVLGIDFAHQIMVVGRKAAG
tara:strand:+ start:2872 stop:3501 length:630 start_codon:yes stop_codon:yes gene_type:complete